MKTVQLTKENFEDEVLLSNKPVFVDFYATWCGPCKMMGVTMERIAERSDGTYKVCKLDVEEAPEIANRYKIRGVPIVLLFRRGVPANAAIGLTAEEDILNLLWENKAV